MEVDPTQWKDMSEPQRAGAQYVNHIRIPVSSESDVVIVRQKGREFVASAGFKGTDVAIVSSLISDVARIVANGDRPGEIVIVIAEKTGRVGIVVIAHFRSAKKFSVLGSRRASRLRGLMDELDIFSNPDETVLIIKKWKEPASVNGRILSLADCPATGGPRKLGDAGPRD